MADNVTLNSGSGGSTLATDDVAGVQHQRVKIEYGVDGSATDVSDTNPLPIDDAGGSLTVDNAALSVTGGGVEASALRVTLASDSTGVISVDDNGSSLTVDNAALSITGGGVEASALRVTLASDSTGVLSVDDNGGSLTVDGTVAVTNTNIDNLNSSDFDTGAGTDTTPSIGIAVPASGGAAVITGDPTNGLDVDVTRVQGTVTVDASGTAVPVTDNGGSITVDNAALAITGGGVEASALRVTIASDSTGLVSVDDNGGSLTVDNAALSVTGGGVEASALRVTLATDSTGVLSVDDNGGSLTVDNGGTFAVQVSSALPAGTNAIGKLAANSGVDIGDVDILSIAAGTNLVGDVGISGARTSGGTTLYKNIDVDETEDQVKASAGQIYWIHAMNLSASVLYLKIYNATAASVTVGTTVPDLTFPIPTQGDTNGAGFAISIPNGIAFSTAITIAATTGVADADSGAPGTNACVVNLGYA